MPKVISELKRDNQGYYIELQVEHELQVNGESQESIMVPKRLENQTTLKRWGAR